MRKSTYCFLFIENGKSFFSSLNTIRKKRKFSGKKIAITKERVSIIKAVTRYTKKRVWIINADEQARKKSIAGKCPSEWTQS